jgi:hypothetical protein
LKFEYGGEIVGKEHRKLPPDRFRTQSLTDPPGSLSQLSYVPL